MPPLNSRGVVPYIVSWSAEECLPATVIERPWSGIGYVDETLADRDARGVLWQRVTLRRGHGRPEFGRIHPLRQRRAMRKLLCGICAGPPDCDERGVLWLVRDYRGDWPNWPEHMGATEPPICLPYARLSVRMCPSLRKGYVALRVGESAVSGIYGARYRVGNTRVPIMAGDEVVAFGDPAIRWTCATQLVRELTDCVIVDLDTEVSSGGSGPARMTADRGA